MSVIDTRFLGIDTDTTVRHSFDASASIIPLGSSLACVALSDSDLPEGAGQNSYYAAAARLLSRTGPSHLMVQATWSDLEGFSFKSESLHRG